MSGTIKATWVGPYGHTRPDGTVLETGVTVCDVPADEARDSSHWEPVKPVAPAKTKTSKDGD